MIKKTTPKILLSLFACSLLGLGFSSWVFGSGVVDLNVNVESSDLVVSEYGNSIKYKKNTEKCFDYYLIDNKPIVTDSTMSIDLALNPLRMETESSIYQKNIIASISVNYISSKNTGLFNDINYSLTPSSMTFSLVNSSQYNISFPVKYSNSLDNNGNYVHKLSCEFDVYSIDGPSLYSYFKKYQKNISNDLIIHSSLDFDFEATADAKVVEILNQEYFFTTTLKGV